MLSVVGYTWNHRYGRVGPVLEVEEEPPLEVDKLEEELWVGDLLLLIETGLSLIKYNREGLS